MLRRLASLICTVAALWMPLFAHAFAISPATVDLTAAPGEKVEQTIAIINNGAAEQTYYLGTQSFLPDVASGNPQFISGDDDQSGLSGWIDFPVPSVVIPPRTKVDVPFVVSIPSDAEPGTHYVAVTVSVAPSDIVATNGATIEAKTAQLVFVTVEGNTVERIALLDFVSPDEGEIKGMHDLSYTFRIQNQGNVAVRPAASIVVKDMFGRVVFNKDANAELGRVLPGTTRTFSGELVDQPTGFIQTIRLQWNLLAIGPMTATLVVEGLDPTNTPSIQYGMFPRQLSLCVIGAIVALWLIWRGFHWIGSKRINISTGS